MIIKYDCVLQTSLYLKSHNYRIIEIIAMLIPSVHGL